VDRLADPHASRVILVGGARYGMLPPLPTVAHNLAALRELVTDPDLWGLPPDNCVTLLDPSTPLQVDAAVRAVSASVRPEGLLLFYFAGHGLIDPRTGGLHLAVEQTERDAVYATAMPYEWVRRAFLDAPAGWRVVILDCCYSGRAIAGMGPGSVADEAEIDLACVLVAASANRAALAPPDEPYTSFTGSVIELLRTGLPGGPDLLDLNTIYQHVSAVQRSLGRPLPELRARNGGERIPLARNRAAAGPRPTDTDQPPAGSPELIPGLVLTGTARLPDPELAGASVALLAYDPLVGALGVRLGRTLHRPATEVLGARTAGALATAALYDGGPVRASIVLIMRPRTDAEVPGYRALDAHLGTAPVTTDPDLIDAAWLFLGYVGWRPGQLEMELAQGAFVVSHRVIDDWLTRSRGD
jgi:putative AlgH/UPF0301 family transcriptional regulator